MSTGIKVSRFPCFVAFTVFWKRLTRYASADSLNAIFAPAVKRGPSGIAVDLNSFLNSIRRRSKGAFGMIRSVDLCRLIISLRTLFLDLFFFFFFVSAEKTALAADFFFECKEEVWMLGALLQTWICCRIDFGIFELADVARADVARADVARADVALEEKGCNTWYDEGSRGIFVETRFWQTRTSLPLPVPCVWEERSIPFSRCLGNGISIWMCAWGEWERTRLVFQKKNWGNIFWFFFKKNGAIFFKKKNLKKKSNRLFLQYQYHSCPSRLTTIVTRV